MSTKPVTTLFPTTAPTWPAIARITVRDLFGRYSYNAQPASSDRNREENVAILYGDNGSGKTTLLKLLYSCLSRNDGEGNRTLLAQTPFSFLRVDLHNSSYVEVEKPRNNLLGSYTFKLHTPDRNFSLDVVADKENSVKGSLNSKIDTIADELKRIDIDLLFLHDDRTIQSTYESFRPKPKNRMVFTTQMAHDHLTLFDDDVAVERPRFQDIEQALRINMTEVIKAVSDWLRQKAFQRSSSGEEDASNVYLNVVRTLSYWGEKRPRPMADRRALIGPLHTLTNSLKSYNKFGLVGSYPVSEFIQLIESVPDERLADVAAVLSPYIDSVITRIAAMDEVRSVMATFEEEINSYLRDKQSNLHITSGLNFVDTKGQRLLPSALSSGERQLLFLFCAALLSRGGQSIFIVDEPELSLNIKWQRRLISSLSKLAQGASTQFIVATHSLEIMAQHRGAVIELE